MNGQKIKHRVGKYDVGRTIGEGTFAKVKFARNSQTGEAVALKILDKVKVNNPRRSEKEAHRYFQQLINAVDYCHSRGVFQRPEKNLLLDASGNLKVSDFGLSALSQGMMDCFIQHVELQIILLLIWRSTTMSAKGYHNFQIQNKRTFISAAEFTFPPWLSFSARKLITKILDPNPMTRITVPEILRDEWFKKDYKPPAFEETKETNVDDVEAVFKDYKGFKREIRFTSKCPANEIIKKIEEAAKPLGFDVQKKNFKFYNKLSTGLEDVVWKTEDDMEDTNRKIDAATKCYFLAYNKCSGVGVVAVMMVTIMVVVVVALTMVVGLE
ncbi:hypothetical protein JHK84_055207 [Glycine max]|nr:hypothetical protein JHK86_055184 [Glycine max]KAG5073976.1 hypothetical protein JHK84_055207 [Glycine max]